MFRVISAKAKQCSICTSRLLNLLSATINIFQITAIALSTLLNRFAASVRSLSAANGDSTTFVVLRCLQCSAGKS